MTTSNHAPDQGEAKPARPLTADDLEAQLDALEAKIAAQPMVTMRQSERIQELRRQIGFMRLNEQPTEVAMPA